MTRNQNSDRIMMGVILSPHGIKGDVMVKSFAEVPADIAAYGPLESADGQRTFDLSIVRETHKGLTARIAGFDDRTAVEALKGTELYLPRDRLPEPTTDAYYHADLIGLSVVDPDGNAIGTVKAVQNFGASDILEIAKDGTGDIDMVPFTDAFVADVCLETRKITVVRAETDAEH